MVPRKVTDDGKPLRAGGDIVSGVARICVWSPGVLLEQDRFRRQIKWSLLRLTVCDAVAGSILPMMCCIDDRLLTMGGVYIKGSKGQDHAEWHADGDGPPPSEARFGWRIGPATDVIQVIKRGVQYWSRGASPAYRRVVRRQVNLVSSQPRRAEVAANMGARYEMRTLPRVKLAFKNNEQALEFVGIFVCW